MMMLRSAKAAKQNILHQGPNYKTCLAFKLQHRHHLLIPLPSEINMKKHVKVCVYFKVFCVFIQALVVLTVYGGDVDGNVDIASSFGPCAAGGRAWDCVPTFARSNVTVGQWSLCRITKHTKHLSL